MNNIIQLDTAITVSIIAMIAAILGPSVSAAISSYFSYKTKKVELLFKAKSDAYNKLIEIAATDIISPSNDNIKRLHQITMNAALYSTAKTAEKIANYTKAIIMQSDDTEVALAQKNAIQAMHNELVTYRKLMGKTKEREN